MFDIIGKRFWFFILSGVVILISIMSLAVFSLKPGLDFTGGSLTTLSFKQAVDQVELEHELVALGYEDAQVQRVGDAYSIRSGVLNDEAKINLENALEAKFGPITEAGFEKVDPVIAREAGRIAAIGVAAAAVGILLYLWWAFRKMPSPFRYGAVGVAALLHDVLVVVGIFSIIGKILGWEIDLMFITGILAVIGYSINNTVIIFDRIRENVKMGVSPNFAVIVNNSVVQTMGRSLNTNLTTLFPILALMLFVGASIHNFLFILMMGIIVGMYDSICVAPALLVVWQERRRQGSR